jgi:hypothetical protein
MFGREPVEGTEKIPESETAIMTGHFVKSRCKLAVGVGNLVPPLAQPGIEGVSEDRKESGAHVCTRLVLFDMRPGLNKRVVNEIVSTRCVSGETHRKSP